jgi:Rieske Fe-S protein
MTSTLNRRAVLAGTCAAGCAAALTACSTYSSTSAPQTSAAPAAGAAAAPAPAPAAGGAAPLVTAGQVPVGGGVIVAAQQVVVTQPTAGRFKAFSTTCTHQGCAVNEVTGGKIVCPCHGSEFAVADGSVTAGPARSPLPEKKITVSGDAITLA